MNEHERIRVVTVDDHVTFRKGVTYALLGYDDIEVVGEAASGEEALRLYREMRPDVVLMDLMMSGMGGVEAIRRLLDLNPDAHVIALTGFQDGDLVQEALQAGALGYLVKDVALDELAKAVRLAYHGMPTLAPSAAQALVHSAINRPPPLGRDLTDREREVLALLAEGLTNLQIADRLVISPATVKFHARSIRSKLGSASRTETVVLALHHHLVDVDVGARGSLDGRMAGAAH
jgi:NarL family two-component system response regulator LiaR